MIRPYGRDSIFPLQIEIPQTFTFSTKLTLPIESKTAFPSQLIYYYETDAAFFAYAVQDRKSRILFILSHVDRHLRTSFSRAAQHAKFGRRITVYFPDSDGFVFCRLIVDRKRFQKQTYFAPSNISLQKMTFPVHSIYNKFFRSIGLPKPSLHSAQYPICVANVFRYAFILTANPPYVPP